MRLLARWKSAALDRMEKLPHVLRAVALISARSGAVTFDPEPANPAESLSNGGRVSYNVGTPGGIMTVHVPVPQDQLAAFCRHHHIRRLAFFGSVLRADFGADSDVDVLVEFERDHTPGFLRLATMEQ